MDNLARKVCFICQCQFKQSPTNKLENGEETCLKFRRHLSRYIQVNLPDNIGQNIFCDQCHSNVIEFCEMFENLEKVRLKLFSIVDKISTVMTSTAKATTNQNAEDNRDRDHEQFVEEFSVKVEEKRKRLFPTVNLTKLDSKNPLTHEGNLDLDDFVKQEIIHKDDDDDDCNISDSAELPDFFDTEEICGKVDQQDERFFSSEQIVISKAGILRIKPPKGQGQTSLYPCTFCTRIFKNAAKLMSHLRRHICEKPFICRFCPQEATIISNLVSHERAIHQNIKPKKKNVVCDICGKSFTKPYALKLHIMAIHQGIKPFQCKICGKQFFNSGSRTQHYQRAHSDDRPFSCDKCPSTFKLRVDLQAHQKKVHKADTFSQVRKKKIIPNIDYQPCDVCGKKFANEHILNVHKIRFHSDSGDPLRSRTHKCTHPGCDRSFFFKSELERHSFKHITGERPCRPFKCTHPGCDWSFFSKKDLQRHSLKHTGERPFKCDQCPKSFVRKANLLGHMDSHNEVRLLLCNICGNGFSNRSSLKQHERAIHQNIEPKNKVVCDICGKSYTKPYALKLHIMAIHQGIKQFQCKICGKQFFNAWSRSQHYQRAHSDDRPFSCDKCPSTFKIRIDLQTHQKRVHEVKITRKKTIPKVDYQPCDICGKKFSNEHILNAHKTRFHSDSGDPRSSRPHKCTHPGCDWSFFSKMDLERHSLKHTGERPFKCDQCPKSFVRKANLLGHLDSHNEVRLLLCNICGKGFSHRSTLKQHEKNHGKL